MLKLPLVPISIDPYVNPIAISLSKFPLANIIVALSSIPHSRTVFQTAEPLALIKFSIWPLIFSHTFRFAINVITLKDASILKLLITHSVFIVAFPLSFVYAIVRVKHYSISMPFSINNLSIICRVFVLFKFQVVGLMQLLEVNYIGLGLVGLEFVENSFVPLARTEGFNVGLSNTRFIVFVLSKFVQISVVKRHELIILLLKKIKD